MRKLRAIVLVTCLGISGVAVSHADSLIGYFNLTCPSGTCNPSQNDPTSSVPAAGQVIFTLNSDGTIAANLEKYAGEGIVGFGFNSVGNTVESGFSPITPSDAYGWGDAFGIQYGGFGAFDTNGVGLKESWIIGNPGDFSSVFQALDGGPNSTVDFFLWDGQGQWGGNAQPYEAAPPVPEPGSFMLLGSGALALAAALRRKLAL